MAPHITLPQRIWRYSGKKSRRSTLPQSEKFWDIFEAALETSSPLLHVIWRQFGKFFPNVDLFS
jgi:hypothetical protein